METKQEPLLLSVFISTRLHSSSPLTESSENIKWCPSCASPLVVLLETFRESTNGQFLIHSLPQAMCSGKECSDERRDAILTGGWYCRSCGLHMLPFSPSVTNGPDLIVTDKEMPFLDSLEIFDDRYKTWEDQVISSCGQLLQHIREAFLAKMRSLDDRWKDMNKCQARLRTRNRDLSDCVDCLAASEQRYQERLMKFNDYRDSLMRSIQIQLDDIRRREENLMREDNFKELTENQMATKCRQFTKTPERKVELSSEKHEGFSSQSLSTNGNQNLFNKDFFTQVKYPETRNPNDVSRSPTKDYFKIISSGQSSKSGVNERSPKFRELLKNFEEQSSPEGNGFQGSASQKKTNWGNESCDVWTGKESRNTTPQRNVALGNEVLKALKPSAGPELNDRESLHKVTVSHNAQLISCSSKNLSQTMTWLRSSEMGIKAAGEHSTKKNIDLTLLNDDGRTSLSRVVKKSTNNEVQHQCSSSKPWSKNATENHLTSSANLSQSNLHEDYYATPSNSLENSVFHSKLCQLAKRRSRQNIDIKSDFVVYDASVFEDFHQSVSCTDEGTKTLTKPAHSSQKIDLSDKSTWMIRPRLRESKGSHIPNSEYEIETGLQCHRMLSLHENSNNA